MEITGKYYFLLFLSSFVIVSSITPVVRRIAIHLRIFDHPKASHKTHQIAVPYLGGVAIILGVLITTFSSIFISSFTLRFSSLVFSIFLPALILGLVGLVDDTLSLKPWPRFLVQSFTAAVSTFFLISNNQIGVSSGSKLFDYVISIFWIVGICNAINLFDNITINGVKATGGTIFIQDVNGDRLHPKVSTNISSGLFYTKTGPGVYNIKYVSSQFGCTKTDSFSVIVHDTSNLIVRDTTICANSLPLDVLKLATSNKGGTIISYPDGRFFSGTKTLTGYLPGPYKWLMVGLTPYNCQDTEYSKITIVNVPTIK